MSAARTNLCLCSRVFLRCKKQSVTSWAEAHLVSDRLLTRHIFLRHAVVAYNNSTVSARAGVGFKLNVTIAATHICSTGMNFFRRILPIGLCCLIAWSISAYAHPHVWITMRTQVIYAPDGGITGVHHAWAFDDMFSTFVTQGLENWKKGKFTREELAPLAKSNLDSSKNSLISLMLLQMERRFR